MQNSPASFWIAIDNLQDAAPVIIGHRILRCRDPAVWRICMRNAHTNLGPWSFRSFKGSLGRFLPPIKGYGALPSWFDRACATSNYMWLSIVEMKTSNYSESFYRFPKNVLKASRFLDETKRQTGRRSKRCERFGKRFTSSWWNKVREFT